MSRRVRTLQRAATVALLTSVAAMAAPPGAGDARLRTAVYDADEVYRLEAYAGFQIDLEFEPGEHFTGLGAGDVDSLAYAAAENHLFLKPRAGEVSTNLTVITSRRTYHFDYLVRPHRGAVPPEGALYALRFVYAPPPADGVSAVTVEKSLQAPVPERARNLDYAYCGSPMLQPASAWDDGVQTHLRFSARQELPALFVADEEGGESLVNFTVQGDEVVIHRIARRFIVRRGALAGCVVNQRFAGSGAALDSGTITPAVQRRAREAVP